MRTQEQILRRKQRKDAIRLRISEYKEKLGCADCKGFYPACALDFDHRDPLNKKFSLGHDYGHRNERDLWSEI